MNNDWDQLRYFLALARDKTLTCAGHSLQVSHSTVFRKIKAMEDELGVTLFENTSTGYSLTEAGLNLLEETEEVGEVIESSFRRLIGLDQRVKGSVVLATTESIAGKLLPLSFQKFQEQYPEIQLEIRVGQETLNLSKREADIAIRQSRNPPLNLVGRKIAPLAFALFAHQSYIEKKGAIDFPNDIDQHHFILLDESMSFLEAKSWLDRKVGNPAGMIKVNSMITLVQLCEAGLGIAAFPDYPKTFLNPQLKRIMGLPKFKESSLWILTHKDLIRSKRIRLATDFFYQELKHSILAMGDHS